MPADHVHFNGSVNLGDAESVMREIASRVPSGLRRIPDGETGDRGNWIFFQLQKFLQGKLLKSATITGIGPGRVAMLSAYGIDTADDIVTERVAQVPQFGPVLTDRLVGWRRDMERAFVYDSSRPLPREAVDRIEKDIEDARRRVVEDLRRALRDLRAAKVSESATAKAAAQRMGEATRALRQAEADVIAATGKVPV